MGFIKKNDSRSGVYLTRWLEQVMPKLYEKRYPKLHGSSGEDVPINSGLQSGATELVEESLFTRGSADLVDFDSDNYNTVDISIEEERFPIKVYGNAIKWTDRELVSAARGQVQLKERRLKAARYYIEEVINRVTYFGEPRVPGFYGLLNNPSVTLATIDDINFYTEASPDDLCQLFFDIANATNESTNMVEETSVMLIPDYLFNYITSKRVTDGNDKTVLRYIMENSPYIKSIKPRLEMRNLNLVEGGVEVDDTYERILSYSVSPETCERYYEPIQVTEPHKVGLHRWMVGMFCATSPVIPHYHETLRYTKILRRPDETLLGFEP